MTVYLKHLQCYMRKIRFASELKFASLSTPHKIPKIRTSQIKPTVRYVSMHECVQVCMNLREGTITQLSDHYGYYTRTI